MKRISANQRTLNILNKVLSLGFEFNENDTLEDIRIAAEEFLIDNVKAEEVECEVKNTGRSQHVEYNDMMGYIYECDGEIVDFSAHWKDEENTKVIYQTVIDSEAKVIDLYYLVGKTDYNAN